MIDKPYDHAAGNRKPYSVGFNWQMKIHDNPEIQKRHDTIKAHFGKERGDEVLKIWKEAYNEYKEEMLTKDLVPNVLIRIDDFKIHEYFGQRDSLANARESALISLARDFDWRQFEPIKLANYKDQLYCYDGGGRAHVVYAAGLGKIPCSIVKVNDFEHLRQLFMDQKKLVSTIGLDVKYIQHLAHIQQLQDRKRSGWWDDPTMKQENRRQWYNVFKLLRAAGLRTDASELTGLGTIKNAYSKFAYATTKIPNKANLDENSVPETDALPLVAGLKLYKSFLEKNPKEGEVMPASLVCYLAHIIFKLSSKTSVSIGTAQEIVENALDMAYDAMQKEAYKKGFSKYFSEKILGDGLTGANSWLKYDEEIGHHPKHKHAKKRNAAIRKSRTKFAKLIHEAIRDFKNCDETTNAKLLKALEESEHIK